MTVSEIIRELGLSAICPEASIDTVAQHPSQARNGSVFVCIRGARHDGHDHAPEAYRNGCRLFIAQHDITLPEDARILTVPDTRIALAQIASLCYGNPSHHMRIIGVTGTKGKTTVASMLSQILNQAGIPCGYMGTNGVAFGKISYPLQNTTPDPITLQSTLRDMLDHGIQAAVLEISSQAVYQSRIEGMQFDTCIYTNLYSDHIGPHEHPDFEHYRSCKHRLFTDYGCRLAIGNSDDPYWERMIANTSADRTVACSTQKKDTPCFAEGITPIASSAGYCTAFSVCRQEERANVTLPLLGAFNASNALLAIATARECFDVPLSLAAQILSNASVTGRTEVIRIANGATAVIDYAHNGSSLSHLLTALRAYRPTRLICLFGSVGERSQLRRRELGDAAAALADLAILTSDNPGTEDPQAIIDEIARSFQGSKTPYLCIVDRAEAIRTAVSLCQRGDILVLAGKGHENYQLIGRERLPHSDKAILQTVLIH